MNAVAKEENAIFTRDLVIFGGTGDLATRKLIPALFRGMDSVKDTRIIAVAHNAPSTEEFRRQVRELLRRQLESAEYHEVVVTRFLQMLFCVRLNVTDVDRDWPTFVDVLGDEPVASRVFYLALPPQLFGLVCCQLHSFGLIGKTSRVVLEKPIGYDRKSARQINDEVSRYFREDQIFRIDHYLGKETVQNLLALRFSNLFFEKMWNNNCIDQVQITIAETVGLEDRGNFYDRAGALRDMVQNHILQLLCLVAMEPPVRMDAVSIRVEKLKVLQALRTIEGEGVDAATVRGQYQAGQIAGKDVPSYMEELDDTQSNTETYIALCAHIDNWRWKGVPFYLRTGKRLQDRFAEIVIQFKPVPHMVYEEATGEIVANRLVIRLQPQESMQIHLMTKDLQQVATHLQARSLNLNFSDDTGVPKSDGYTRLLSDSLEGNPTLFTHRDEVDLAWAWINPILEHWQKNEDSLQYYPAGSRGPGAADDLIGVHGHHWMN